MAILICFFYFRIAEGRKCVVEPFRLREQWDVSLDWCWCDEWFGGFKGTTSCVCLQQAILTKYKGRSVLIAFFFFCHYPCSSHLHESRNGLPRSAYIFGGFGVLVSLTTATLGSWLAPKVSQMLFRLVVLFFSFVHDGGNVFLLNGIGTVSKKSITMIFLMEKSRLDNRNIRRF